MHGPTRWAEHACRLLFSPLPSTQTAHLWPVTSLHIFPDIFRHFLQSILNRLPRTQSLFFHLAPSVFASLMRVNEQLPDAVGLLPPLWPSIARCPPRTRNDNNRRGHDIDLML